MRMVWNDDQESLQMAYMKNTKDIKLDSNCELFQVMWDEDFGRSANFDVLFNNSYIYNELTDTYPCILHSHRTNWSP